MTAATTRASTVALTRSATTLALLLLIALAAAPSARAAEPQQGRANSGAPGATRGSTTGNTAGSAAGGPSIKALFEEELVVDGRNIEQEAWRQAQDDCRQAGYPIRALSEAQASLLGVTTIELAQDIDRRHLRITEHRIDRDSDAPRDQCQVRFHQQVLESRQDRQQTVVYDSRQPDTRAVSASAAGILPGVLAKAAINARRATAASQDEGWFGPETRTLAGASCNFWQHSRLPESMCVWADGAQWGWTPGVIANACPGQGLDRFSRGIPLAVEPTIGVGCRLRVVQFSSGQPLGDADFEMRLGTKRGD